MSSPVNLTKPDRPVHVGVILMNGRTEILDVAPVDMFNGMSKTFVDSIAKAFPAEFLPAGMQEQIIDFQIHWVSQDGPSGAPSRLTSNITLAPTDSFETCPPLDIVLIGAHEIGYTPNEVELAFVHKSWEECSAFLTICGGILVPLQAGILEGKTVTGPRFMLDMLRQQAPSTNWVEKRWTRDGKLWTSGALLNGTDLVYEFASEYWGHGEDSLVQFLGRIGAWPSRDIGYKDVAWAL